jgi:diguanylate cyclase (GGDEF)-like protein/PAS domain S-box-containing protein
MQSLLDIFAIKGLIPHGYCLSWNPVLLWLHVISDLLIMLACYSIPLMLIYFIRQRKGLPYWWLFIMTAGFVLACGTTHLLSVITIWIPLYWLDGLMKALTAIIAISTAVQMLWVIPYALALPSAAQLQAKIEQRKILMHALHKSERRYHSLYDLNDDAVMLLNEEGFFDCNKATLALFGCTTREEFYTKHLAELSPEQQPCNTPSLILANQHIAAAIKNGCHRFDWVHKRNDSGTTFLAKVKLDAIVMDGEPVLQAVIRDITAHKKADKETRLAAAIFESQQGMVVTDANKIILRINKAFSIITGYTAEDVIGQKVAGVLKSDRHNGDFYADMLQRIDSTGQWNGEIWHRRKNGEHYPEYLTITAVYDMDGQLTHYVSTFEDITVRKATEDQIKHMAFYDPLTQLPNRQMLQNRLKPALASSYRSGQKGAVLFIDLDNFKTLNDTLGHDMGDLLLQQVAQRLVSTVRENDTVARLGGDEFVLMLEDLSDDPLKAAAQTEVVGNKILAELNQSYQLDTYIYHSTPSIGATLFNGHDHSMAEIMKQADIAMYQAKDSGRNALRFFDAQMQDSINASAAIEADLHLALAEHQFELYYQPQVCHNQQIMGAEALLRWQHPQRGWVSPGDFIPLAEETGLILPIGQWVLETACAQLKIWERSVHTQHLQLAVNVSAKQFHLPDFVEQVSLVLNRHAINPHRLKLELTETMVLNNVDDTLIKMKTLKKTGVYFSMDDFGTGHSSLSILKKLPFDQLKIDQSFVRDISIDHDDEVIVKIIIQMAINLGMEIIAEGVETQAQHEFLKLNGCPSYQGYLFSKPLPIEQFDALLLVIATAN